ncbi:MAG: chloride channel protein [Planctomycetota bacterium]
MRDLERRAQVAWFALARWFGLSSREELSFFILVPLVGVVTGFVGVGIYELIDWVQFTAWGKGSLLERAQESARTTPWLNVVAPLVGGIAVALVIKVFRQEVRGHGMSGIIEAVALKGGRVEPGPALLREFAGVLTVGTGGSLGREGPMIRTGSMLGSVIGQLGGIHGRRLKILVAAGAAAGMSAAYNAPIGGAFFALEVILGNFALEVFGPVVIASALATFVARYFRFHGFVYDMVPEYSLHSAWELPAYLVLGVLAGPLSIFFARAVRGGEKVFDRLTFVPKGIRPIVGMTLLGLLGIACPYVYGNGFDAVNLALHDPLGQLGLGLLLVLPFMKVLATAITLGAGCSGGLFTPALFFGALLGALFGVCVNAIMPGHAAPPGAYALGGMAAITAGTSHAPISSLIIVFELTGKYEAILPLMLASMASAAVARRLNKYSIYTEALHRRGIELPSRLEEIVLETIRVQEALHPDRDTVKPAEPIAGVLDRLVRARRTHVFVVDPGGRYRGAVALHDLVPALQDPGAFKSVVAADLIDTHYPSVPDDMRLAPTLPIFARVDGELLPVVTSEGSFRGVLGKQDVLALYAQEVLGHPAMLARISSQTGSSYVPLPHGFELRELHADALMTGKTLVELELPQKHGIWVLAVIRRDEAGRETRELARARTQLQTGDILVALGSAEGFGKVKPSS